MAINRKRIFVGVLVGVALLVFGYLVQTGDVKLINPLTMNTDGSATVLTFNEKTPLRVTVVRDGAAMRTGLSGKESLGPVEGMLFVFSADGYHGIWMKDMRFPIDIAWIDGEGKVVSIQENATPDTYPRTFEPTSPARFVVEANAYFFNSFDIRVGAMVRIPQEVLPVDLQK